METSKRYENNEWNLTLAARGDENAVERLIKDNYTLVTSIAHRFLGRGCEYEDLIQIGMIGMLKAIRSFDLSRGTAFSTYAVPMIMGEIKKYLRDDGIIKVGRVRKQNAFIVMRAKEKYRSEHFREAKLSDISEATGLSLEEITEALDAASPVTSLSSLIGDNDELTIENTSAVSENPFDAEIEKIALYESLNSLDETRRKIIALRYFKCLSQQETADALGLTQVKISREEKKIFAQLRKKMEGDN